MSADPGLPVIWVPAAGGKEEKVLDCLPLGLIPLPNIFKLLIVGSPVIVISVWNYHHH